MGDVVSLLSRPVYGYPEVDRLLRLTPGTAKRWIDGYERNGVEYDPILREHRTGASWVSWGEFIETRLLAEYRSNIPMIKLRPVVRWLRDHVSTEYPLAYGRQFLHPEGREMLIRAQAATGLDEELWLALANRQGVLLTATSLRFTSNVNFGPDGSAAESVRADAATPDVLLHPGKRQGQPTVAGIRTETLAGLVGGGDSMEFVAESYGLSTDLVHEAVAYEASRRRAS